MQTNEEVQTKLVDVNEMARLLSVPKSWIYQRTHMGTIPCTKIGKYVRFDPIAVFAFFKKNQAVLERRG